MLGSRSETAVRGSQSTMERALETIDWLIDSVNSLASEFGGITSSKTEAQASHQRKVSLKLESLESRQMMSVAPLTAPDDLVPVGGCDDLAMYADEIGNDLMPLGFDASGSEGDAAIGFDSVVPLGFDDSSPLGDAMPSGSSYMLVENWGGMWCDAEKTPSNTEDDLLCWAGASSNILAWGGWGTDFGLDTTDDIFGYYQDHWTDQGGLMQFGWEWFFTGVNDSQGWGGWSQVDVAGGGFYDQATFNDNYMKYSYGASSAAAMDDISGLLNNGYGVTLGIYGPGGHAITCWGYNYDDATNEVLGLWITDSDDMKYTNSPSDQLRYYEVELSGSAWYLQDYYGSDAWFVDYVAGLKAKDSSPAEPETPADPNTISGTVFDDTNASGTQDGGESGIAGATVYLDANNNGSYDAATSEIFQYQEDAIAINDLGWTYSTITVDSDYTSIDDLNVQLDISHTYIGDLTIYLTSPDGEKIKLFSGIGGSADSFTDTILDDEAVSSISGNLAPFTGSFKPFQSLSTFDGMDLNGEWTLSIQDCYSQDVGSLLSWGLVFGVGETSTTTDANGNFTFEDVPDGTYSVRAVNPEGWFASAGASGQSVALSGGDDGNADFGFFQDVPAIPDIGTITATSLGAIDYGSWGNIDLSGGEQWYQVWAMHDGYFSVMAEAQWSTAVAQVIDSEGGLIEQFSIAPGESVTHDLITTSGTEFYIRVLGGGMVDLSVANLVSTSGSDVNIIGTDGDDSFTFTAGNGATDHVVTINGFEYSFGTAAATDFYFNGGDGEDTAELTGNDATVDVFTAMPGEGSLASGSDYDMVAQNVERITAFGSEEDIAYLFDSAGDDTLVARPENMTLTGTGFENSARGFGEANALAFSGGHDRSTFYDSAEDDNFYSDSSKSTFTGDGFMNRADGFDHVVVHSSMGGYDIAELHGSDGDDTLKAARNVATFFGQTFFKQAHGFDKVDCYGAGGNDVAYLYGTYQNDTFHGSSEECSLFGNGYSNSASGFNQVSAFGYGGYDITRFYDSSGNDTLNIWPYYGNLSGSDYFVEAAGFEKIVGFAYSGGWDTMKMHGSSGNDQFFGNLEYKVATMFGQGYVSHAQGFDRTDIFGQGGYDFARFFDTTGDDTLKIWPNNCRMLGSGYDFRLIDFDKIVALSNYDGQDTLEMYGSWGADQLWLNLARQSTTMTGSGYINHAQGFNNADVFGVGGYDVCQMIGSNNQDNLDAEGYSAEISNSNASQHINSFEKVFADLGGSNDLATRQDVLFQLTIVNL